LLGTSRRASTRRRCGPSRLASTRSTQTTRVKRELADAGGRNEQLTVDRAELERTLMMKSDELGKSIADLRPVSSTYEQLEARAKPSGTRIRMD